MDDDEQRRRRLDTIIELLRELLAVDKEILVALTPPKVESLKVTVDKPVNQ